MLYHCADDLPFAVWLAPMHPMQGQRRMAAGCPDTQLEAQTLHTTHSRLTKAPCCIFAWQDHSSAQTGLLQGSSQGLYRFVMRVSLWRARARMCRAASCSSAASAAAMSSVSAASSEEFTCSRCSVPAPQRRLPHPNLSQVTHRLSAPGMSSVLQ